MGLFCRQRTLLALARPRPARHLNRQAFPWISRQRSLQAPSQPKLIHHHTGPPLRVPSPQELLSGPAQPPLTHCSPNQQYSSQSALSLLHCQKNQSDPAQNCLAHRSRSSIQHRILPLQTLSFPALRCLHPRWCQALKILRVSRNLLNP